MVWFVGWYTVRKTLYIITTRKYKIIPSNQGGGNTLLFILVNDFLYLP